MPTIEQRVVAHWPKASGALPGGGGPVAVRSILNYGGFSNRSFQLTAGESSYHLKLSSDPHSLRRLRRWRDLATPLSASYRAPAMRGWIDLPGTPFAGPVFDWIDGTPPQAVQGGVREVIVETIGRLHADSEMAASMRRRGDTTETCASAYQGTYHDRFVEDLKLVRAEPPSFISSDLIAWMTDESAALSRMADAAEAFLAPAEAASHRDLWPDNLLVTRSGTAYILDWDEAGLGDEMMDWAMLFGPSRSRVRPASERDLPRADFSTAQRKRFAHYARASLLDWVIDPLADWVDAARQREHGAAVRTSNRRVFERALRAYAEIYAVPTRLL